MSQQQFNLSAPNDADSYYANVNWLLDQLVTLRKKHSAGEIHSSDLIAWEDPMITVYTLESMCRMANQIRDLQSDIIELEKEKCLLQENISLINEVLSDPLDDSPANFGVQSSDDYKSSTPSAHGLLHLHLVQ